MGAITFSIDERLLAVLVKALPLQRFVETGTFQGASLQIARQFFPECHSVELSPALHEAARQRFANDSGVHLHLGESPAVLRDKAELFRSSPTLFWLDAHWCCADATSGAESQTPLVGELEAIGSLHADSVVLIDDARLYLCPPGKPHATAQWPSFHTVLTSLLRLSPVHRLMICNDVIILFPAAIQAQVDQFAYEHGADWLIIADESRLFRQPKPKKPKKRRWYSFR